jgi:hypothetical protein
MDQAASAALEQKYKKLWVQYKLTVTGLYFSDKPLSGEGELQAGIRYKESMLLLPGRSWGAEDGGVVEAAVDSEPMASGALL